MNEIVEKTHTNFDKVIGYVVTRSTLGKHPDFAYLCREAGNGFTDIQAEFQAARARMTALEAALRAFVASVDNDDVSDMEEAYEQARAVLKEQVTG